MKSTIKEDLIKNIIDNWWIIRNKLSLIGFGETVTPESELEFLNSKGQIARNLQPMIYKIGDTQDMRNSIIRFLRRISSLYQLRELTLPDLRILEKECHHIYIQLNNWYGKLISE